MHFACSAKPATSPENAPVGVVIDAAGAEVFRSVLRVITTVRLALAPQTPLATKTTQQFS